MGHDQATKNETTVPKGKAVLYMTFDLWPHEPLAEFREESGDYQDTGSALDACSLSPFYSS